ncbi:MAG: hypothetical protein ACR2P7_06565 [bacterium]
MRVMCGQVGVLLFAGLGIEGIIVRQANWRVIVASAAFSLLLMWLSSLDEHHPVVLEQDES